MGSRAVVIVCRDEGAAGARFGVTGEGAGTVYTRTGRPFFADDGLQDALLGQLRRVLTAADFWRDHGTDWAVLDAELMPWSHKAQALLKGQYAPTAAAAARALTLSLEALGAARRRGVGVEGLPQHLQARQREVQGYAEAYRRYCWPVTGVVGSPTSSSPRLRSLPAKARSTPTSRTSGT